LISSKQPSHSTMTLVKNTLRKQYLKHGCKNIKDINRQSTSITNKLISTIVNNDNFNRIGVFMPLDNEVNTIPLIEHIINCNKHVYLPICTDTQRTGQRQIYIYPKDETHVHDDTKKQDHLIFKKINSLDHLHSLKPKGKYKIREPVIESHSDYSEKVIIEESEYLNHLDVLILPAVLLDTETRIRVGYGKGYYDDFIKRYLYTNWKDNEDVLKHIETLKEMKEDHLQGDDIISKYLSFREKYQEVNKNACLPPLLVGIGFDEQIYSGVIEHEEKHDWKMDLIITS
jgi:5-formyltetrahydrofolate cyclo-ligase